MQQSTLVLTYSGLSNRTPAIFFITRMITDRIGLHLVLLPKSSLKTTASHEWFYVISSTDEDYSLHFIQQVVVWRKCSCRFYLQVLSDKLICSTWLLNLITRSDWYRSLLRSESTSAKISRISKMLIIIL